MADVQSYIDNISRQSGYGRRQQAHTNVLYGINHSVVGNIVPYNTDNQGITFFTRPRLNLTYNNIISDRTFTPLLANNGATESMQRAIRVLLDPILGGKDETSVLLAANEGVDLVQTNLIDTDLAFMALLTNHLQSLTGWPDPSADTYQSHDGIYKESWSMIDGLVRNYSTFELNATFRNVAGDPISALFHTWIKYASNVYIGRMMPYPDAILTNEIDYQTRIYRLILDPSRQYVTKIASTGASFPYAVSLGASFSFDADRPFNQNNAQTIDVPFRCMGVEYNDPRTILEFNTVVAMFNQNMAIPQAAGYVKLKPAEKIYHNYYGYPRIDPRTLELQWWVDPADYTPINVNNLGIANTSGHLTLTSPDPQQIATNSGGTNNNPPTSV